MGRSTTNGWPLRFAFSHLLPATDFDGPLFATAFSTPTSPQGHVPLRYGWGGEKVVKVVVIYPIASMYGTFTYT